MLKAKLITLLLFGAISTSNPVFSEEFDVRKALMKKFDIPEMTAEVHKRLGIEYGVLQSTMTICGPCASVIIDVNSRYFASCGRAMPAMELLESYDYNKMFYIAESIYKSENDIQQEQRVAKYAQELSSLECPASLIIKK